jgi:hypothetical protein
MKTINRTDIKLKNGNIISAGTSIDVTALEYSAKLTLLDGREIKIPFRNLHKYFDEFTEEPDIEVLTDWSNDGGCESLRGEWVEPDGQDEEGFPSWLLALGLI